MGGTPKLLCVITLLKYWLKKELSPPVFAPPLKKRLKRGSDLKKLNM
jgi:hypothetical protein